MKRSLLDADGVRALARLAERRHGLVVAWLTEGHAPEWAGEASTPPLRAFRAGAEAVGAAGGDVSLGFDALPFSEAVTRAAHPLGPRFLVGTVDLPTGRYRLAMGPFATPDEAPEIARTIERVGRALPAAVRESLLETLPVLDRRDLAEIQAHFDAVLAEARRHAALLSADHRRLDDGLERERGRPRRLIGRSRPMLELFAMLDKIAASDATVTILGENGTGKELVAREVHDSSARSAGPFIVQNVSAMNDNLLESELFGHRRGAFTGAVQDKQGLFDTADGGTFFLDEVGDMTPALQVKLLRVVQEGTFTPVGDVTTRKVDVRVVCATNRDLDRMVKEGTFREDLYYRLMVIRLDMPPLRARKDDLPLLCDHFLARAAERSGDRRRRFTPEALRSLQAHDWPGNVRELENEIERMLVLAGPLTSLLGEELLSPRIRNRLAELPEGTGEARLGLPEAVERLERRMIRAELDRHAWNKTHAAEALGISRRNLIRKVQEYGFDRRRSEH